MIANLPNPHDLLTNDEFNRFSKIYMVENAISEEICRDIISYGEKNINPESNKHNREFNKNLDNCYLPLNHETHKILEPHWQAAQDFFEFQIDFVEPYDLKKYSEGGFFNRHIDNYHGTHLKIDRKISMTLQLTPETAYEGGQVVFGHHKVSKKYLSATFFPSFYPHYVDKITKGVRWALIGWAWGPYWK